MRKLLRLMVGLLILSSLCLAQLNLDQSALKPLSVCEVLQNLNKFRGRIIEVRGEYRGGDLRATCPPLFENGYEWLTAIHLDIPQNHGSGDEELRQWVFDIEQNQRIISTMMSIATAGSPETVVMATVAGRLDVPPAPRVWVGSDGKRTPIGYGHLGVYPARLIMVRITDIGAEANTSKK